MLRLGIKGSIVLLSEVTKVSHAIWDTTGSIDCFALLNSLAVNHELISCFVQDKSTVIVWSKCVLFNFAIIILYNKHCSAIDKHYFVLLISFAGRVTYKHGKTSILCMHALLLLTFRWIYHCNQCLTPDFIHNPKYGSDCWHPWPSSSSLWWHVSSYRYDLGICLFVLRS